MLEESVSPKKQVIFSNNSEKCFLCNNPVCGINTSLVWHKHCNINSFVQFLDSTHCFQHFYFFKARLANISMLTHQTEIVNITAEKSVNVSILARKSQQLAQRKKMCVTTASHKLYRSKNREIKLRDNHPLVVQGNSSSHVISSSIFMVQCKLRYDNGWAISSIYHCKFYQKAIIDLVLF